MTARWLIVSLALATLVQTGCCCLGPCGGQGGYPVAAYGPDGSCGPDCGGCDACRAPCNTGCGLFANGGCCICIPKPIVWCGTQNECGPHGCDSCACPSDCGLFSYCRWKKTCGNGCSDVYWGEWISDPPDCCDPCDQCFGQWTGPHGYCRLGPMQHLLAALHGYKYCPRPCCDESCGPLLCNKPGCTSCGSSGFDAYGGEQLSHGTVISGPAMKQPVPPGDVYYEHAPHGQSIMTENWNRPTGPKPIPGRPIHKAEQPGPVKLGQSQQPMQPVYGRMVRTAGNFGR